MSASGHPDFMERSAAGAPSPERMSLRPSATPSTPDRSVTLLPSNSMTTEQPASAEVEAKPQLVVPAAKRARTESAELEPLAAKPFPKAEASPADSSNGVQLSSGSAFAPFRSSSPSRSQSPAGTPQLPEPDAPPAPAAPEPALAPIPPAAVHAAALQYLDVMMRQFFGLGGLPHPVDLAALSGLQQPAPLPVGPMRERPRVEPPREEPPLKPLAVRPHHRRSREGSSRSSRGLPPSGRLSSAASQAKMQAGAEGRARRREEEAEGSADDDASVLSDLTDTLSASSQQEQASNWACFLCHSSKTPRWRKDAEGRRLCNACSLRQTRASRKAKRGRSQEVAS